MLKSKRNRRRQTAFANRRKQVEPSRSLQMEGLEDRQMLTASWAGGGVPTSAAESATMGGPTLDFSAHVGQTVNIQLGYATVSGTGAAEADDTSLQPLTVVVPAGGQVDLLKEGAFKVVNDQWVEGDEVVAIQVLSTSVGFTGTAITTHTIVDNESASVAIGDAITESAGSQFPQVKLTTVSLDLDSNNKAKPAILEPAVNGGQNISVSVMDIGGGSAIVGPNAADDVADIPDQTVTFAAGSANGAVTNFVVNTRDDLIVEGTETVVFTLTPSGPVTGGNSTLNINDNESVSVTFDHAADTSLEDSNLGDKFVTVQLTGMAPGTTLAAPLVVPVTIGGTASDGGLGNPDYGIDAPLNPSTLTFPMGSSNGASITYEIDAESGLRDDAVLEGNETLTLTLDNSGNIASTGAIGTYTLTIIDDEVGTISVAVPDATRNESDGTATYNLTVTTSGGGVSGIGPLVIPYTLSGSTLPVISNPPSPYFTDYNQGASGTLTIPFFAGSSTTVPLTINLTNDLQVEGDETLILNLDTTALGLSVTGTPATITVQDNDSATVSVVPATSTFGGDIQATEDTCAFGSVNGTNGATCTSDDARFEVVLSAPSSTPTTVNLVPVNSATSGADYVAFQSQVTIPAGATTSGPITIQILDDLNVELTENIGIKIDSIVSGADPQITIGTNTALIPIADTPDSATLTLTPSDPIASESVISGNDNGQFLFTLSAPVSSPITVTYNLTGSTATNGVDFVSLPGTVTIPANTVAWPVNVQVLDDLIGEPLESVVLNMTSVTTAIPASQLTATLQSATVNIADNDGIVVSVNTTDGDAGESASPSGSNALGKGQYTVTLSNPSATTVTVDYALTGTATGADYTGGIPTQPTAGKFTFPPNTTSLGPFDFNIVDDSLIEGSETVILTISNPAGGGSVLGNPSGTINITDNDTAGAQVSAVTPNATEAPGAANSAAIGRFAFTLPAPSTTATTLFFSLGGVASSSDYQIFTNSALTTALGSNQVTIPANSTGPVYLYVRGVEDVFVEGDESVTLTLTGSSNSSITASGSASVSIVDNDAALISITTQDNQAAEQFTPSNQAQFLLTVNNPNVTLPMQVQYTLAGAATNPDVSIPGVTASSATTGFITVNPGVTSLTLPITAIDDTLVEGTEAFTMQLTGVVSTTTLGGVGINPAASNASADILDNDTAEVFLTYQNLLDQTASEENPADKVPIFIGLTQQSSSDTFVTVSVGGSNNAADAEFLMNPATVPVQQVGHSDYMIMDSAGTTQLIPVQNALTGRFDYTVKIPAGQLTAVVQLMAVNDNRDVLTDAANPGVDAGFGVVEGNEIVNFRLDANASSNSNYTTSASLNTIQPTIVETDKAIIKISDHKNGSTKAAPFNQSSLVEAGANANALIRVDTPIEGELDVFYQYVNGSATAPADFANPGIGQIRFVNTPIGTTNATVAPGQPLVLDPTNDSTFEGTEEFQVQLFASHSNFGATDQLSYGTGDFATVQILDDDQISISVGNTTVTEKNGTDTTTVPVTVTINGSVPAATLQVLTTDGTAVDFGGGVGSNDYNGINGSIVWTGSAFTTPSGGVTDNNNDAVLTFNVVVNGDDVVEGDQKFTINVNHPNVGVANAVQEITIDDDDTLKITANNIAVTEGGVSPNLSITTDKALEGNITLKLNVNDGTAVAEDLGTAGIQGDYNDIAEQSITLPGGAAGTVTLGLGVSAANSNDTVVEGDEHATIALTSVTHTTNTTALLNPVNGTLTVNENGQENVVFTVSPAAVTVTEGQATAAVTVKLTGAGGATSSVPITVNPVTANGSAVGGADFVAIAAGGQPLNFSGALNQSLTANVAIIDDNVIEAQEAFNLTFPSGNISVNTGASITAPATVPITLKDNDSATIEIRNETDGTEGSSDGSFQIGLSGGKVSDVDTFVWVGAGGGSATPVTDFSLNAPNTAAPFSTSAPTLIGIIPAGDNSTTVVVDIVDDSLIEGTETVFLTEQNVVPAQPRAITSPTPGSAADTGTVNINDNDGVVTPNALDVSIKGSSWSVSPYSLTSNIATLAAQELPWVNLDTIQVTYDSTLTSAPAITLLGTNSTVFTPISTSFSGNVASYVFDVAATRNGLPSGLYRLQTPGAADIRFDILKGSGSPLASSLGNVDAGDLSYLIGNWGASVSSPAFFDLNGDGSVGAPDLSGLSGNFGQTLPPAGNAPAPVSSNLPAVATMRATARMARATAADAVFEEFNDDNEDELVFSDLVL